MSDPTELLKGTTPGPWHAVERIRPHRRTTWWVNIGGKYLAEMVPETGLVELDARLIAAAPELARELAGARAEIEALRGRIAGPVAFALWISEQTLTVRKLRKAEVLEWLLSVKHRAIRASRGELDRSCLTTDTCVLDGRHGREWQEEARVALEAKPIGGGQ